MLPLRTRSSNTGLKQGLYLISICYCNLTSVLSELNLVMKFESSKKRGGLIG